MDLPEARQERNVLFDFYEALLTAKQREVFTMHYMDDNSLAEVGEFYGITPQAVADMLRRINGRLNHYDNLLGMTKKHADRQAISVKINHALDDIQQNPSQAPAIITQIRRLIRTLADL